MKHGYGMNRNPVDLRKIGAEKTWIDYGGSKRAERARLVELGVREGDVVLMLSRSDLGRGREIERFEKLIADAGGLIEIVELPEAADQPRGKPGPSPTFAPNYDQERVCRHYWHGPFQPAEVLRQASDVMGFPVSRAMLNKHIGPRSSPRPWINEAPKQAQS